MPEPYPFTSPDMPNADYHARPEVSASILKSIDLKSPAHALVPVTESPAMRFGTLAHCAVLEPGRLADRYRVIEGDRRRLAARDEIERAEAEGVEVITLADRDRALKVSDAVHGVSDARALLEDSDRSIEVSHFWQDGETGLACRARPDLVAQGVCLDLKTTRDASPQGFGRIAANLGYPLQAAHYLTGLSGTGAGRLDFAFLAVETEPPFAAALYDLCEPALIEGTARCARALRMLAACLTAATFPAYPTRGPLCLPSWAFTASEPGTFRLGSQSPLHQTEKEKRDALSE